MANLVSMLNRFIGGRGHGGTGATAPRGTTPGTGTGLGPNAGAAGRRGQDEAIGRGVRGLLSRFRR